MVVVVVVVVRMIRLSPSKIISRDRAVDIYSSRLSLSRRLV